jgi:hypothetical protein
MNKSHLLASAIAAAAALPAITLADPPAPRCPTIRSKSALTWRRAARMTAVLRRTAVRVLPPRVGTRPRGCMSRRALARKSKAVVSLPRPSLTYA